MTNYDLDDQAKILCAGKSAYALARKLVLIQKAIQKRVDDNEKSYQARLDSGVDIDLDFRLGQSVESENALIEINRIVEK